MTTMPVITLHLLNDVRGKGKAKKRSDGINTPIYLFNPKVISVPLHDESVSDAIELKNYDVTEKRKREAMR